MKSLITGALLVASLALTGSTAMAANTATHKYVIRRAPAAARLAERLPRDQFGADLGQFVQSMFDGGLPVRYAGRLSPRSSGASVPSYDSSPSVDTSSAGTDAQAANDAAVQAMQSTNDQSALNDSMAAAEAQNEAAQASALQTEINANN
jgi:hypothetical protein